MQASGPPPGRGSGDPSHHMPPPSSEQPTAQHTPPPGTTGSGAPPSQPPPGYTIPQVAWPAGARMTIPGNAEWAHWFLVELLFVIVWASSDQVDAALFVTLTAITTFAYLIARGIAKAS